jgi:pyruvate dehydrogenase E1 component alpha subunit
VKEVNLKYKYIDKNKIWDKKDEFVRFLDKDGILINKKNKASVSNEKLLYAYKYMVRSRQQDVYMTQLQRQGRMLTFAPNFGEEALQAATGLALKKDDWFVPAFRSNATMLMKGVPLKNQFIYWNGNEKGSKMPEDVNVLPINIPIGTQFSHAAGIAYALKMQNKKAVALTFIGDGGTSEGEFYEAMNIAAINKWPVVFCINNNQWAISTPTKKETSSVTLSVKAVAAGIPAVRVDGNDLIASYEVVNEAINWSKEGNGPVLVEFITWRQGPHTTSDNPREYRTKEAEIENEKFEPMKRIQNYFKSQKIWDDTKDKKLWDEELINCKKAFQESQKSMNSSVDDVFDFTYAKITPELKQQKEEALLWESNKGEK